MGELFVIVISSMLVSNVVLSQFLGICPFLAGSKMYFRAVWFGIFTDDCIYFDHCSISTVCRDGTQKVYAGIV